MAQAVALPYPLPARRAPYDGGVRLDAASDEWLAGRAARGDHAAFEQLVLRYQDRLYTLALRVTLNDADARDCVQDGFISAWRAMERFRGDARFSTWMYRIVLRKAYDVLDRRKRPSSTAGSISTRPWPPSSPTSGLWRLPATCWACRWRTPARRWACPRVP